MSRVFDKVVKSLINNPNFIIKDGKSKRAAALELCRSVLSEATELEEEITYGGLIKLNNAVINEKGDLTKLEFKALSFLSSMNDIELKEDGEKVISTIEIVKAGKFKHPSYGTLNFTEEKFNKFIDNFKSNVVGTDISFDSEHKPEKGAVAWLKDLFITYRNIDGTDTPILSATVEWTSWGIELVDEDIYR